LRTEGRYGPGFFLLIPFPAPDDWNNLMQAHSVTIAWAPWSHIHMH
jgi:hypothetical protein